MKISENTSVSMPVKNMLMIIAGVVAGVFAYTEITARLTSLETSRELFQADLLKKSEQLPTDQEQYMLLEALFSDVEKLQKNQEQNMTNKVNIQQVTYFQMQTMVWIGDLIQRIKLILVVLGLCPTVPRSTDLM
jgi:galactokinase